MKGLGSLPLMNQLSAMTLGCPEWSWEEICTNLSRMGFQGIDVRGIGEHVDLRKSPVMNEHRAESKDQMKAAGLAISCLSSSVKVCDVARTGDGLEEAKGYLDLALTWESPAIRVFGGTGTVDEAVAGLEKVLEIDGATQVTWLLETHDDWIQPQKVEDAVRRINRREVAAAWDCGHTLRLTAEDPRATARRFVGILGGTHIKDARLLPDHPGNMGGWQWCLPGEGDLPLEEVVRELQEVRYSGWITFEHEKRWHPTLPGPEQAFPAFMSWWKKASAL